MSRKLIVTPSAKRDVRQITRWIEERSPSGAVTWQKRWAEALRELTTSNRRCRVAPEDALSGETIYQTVFQTRRGRPYRALFVIRGEVIHVLHVRGPGQNWLEADELEVINGETA